MVQVKLDAIDATRREAEREVEGLEQQRRKFRTQLMEAKTNEVYKTLLSEIETATTRVSEYETKILEQMERAEAAQLLLDAARAVLKEAQGANATDAVRLQADIDSLEEDCGKCQERAAKVRERVPPKFLPTYDRILKGRGHRALSLVTNGHCTECHESVRPQVCVEVLQQTAIHHCSGCGRILYREDNRVTAAAEAGSEAGPADGSGAQDGAGS